MTRAVTDHRFLAGGGEVGKLLATGDWTASPLGPIVGWPPSLRSAVSLILRAPVPMVILWGEEGAMLYNDGYAVIAGSRHPAIIGSKVRESWPEIASFNDNVVRVGLAGGTLAYREQELTLLRNGRPERAWFDLDYSPIVDETGVPQGVLAIVLETTAKVRAERKILDDQARLRQFFDQAPGLMATLEGPDHVFTLANRAYLDLVGGRDVVGKPVAEALPEVVNQGFVSLLDTVRARRAAYVGRGVRVLLQREVGAEPEERFLDFVYQPILDSAGDVGGIFVQGHDVTEAKRAEIAVRETQGSLRALNETLEQRVADAVAERTAAEEALRQAQKMEAMGKLTGGVAHDFNNLLQVISGNLQLLAREHAADAALGARVGNALAAVRQGAKLASQLLAFGRRQPLEPRVVNLGRLVTGMGELLRRTIGEAIEVETVVAADLWNGLVDPTQLEAAILNLAINARDAMGPFGRLTNEVGNARLGPADFPADGDARPGDYVAVAVGDTGSGIAPDILAQVFEPFFSTKPVGKGTGLGLSMVYGFVRQSGGHVAIDSEPGAGTTVRLYLPRTDRPEDGPVVVESGPIAGGTETILVAEDDDDVRATVVALLGDLGYRVLTARDAAGALAVVEGGEPVDLLFTDVVMPGRMRSTELARLVQERRPGVAVLFTSGYTENSIVHGGRLDAGLDLLSKPYSREALARKLRQVLAKSSAAAAAARPRRVLLCEDDALIRMNAADILDEAGIAVVEAGSGRQALDALDVGPVDLCVIDVGLPDMSGIELFLAIRARFPAVPVLFATGHAHLPEVENEPRTATLPKPYDERSLLAAIDRLATPA